MMAADLYIYYRVPVALADTLVERVSSMQDDLHTTTGTLCYLKRRPDAKDGMHTWMEVYLQTDAAFPSHLVRAVDTHALPELIHGERHVETFREVSSCA